MKAALLFVSVTAIAIIAVLATQNSDLRIELARVKAQNAAMNSKLEYLWISNHLYGARVERSNMAFPLRGPWSFTSNRSDTLSLSNTIKNEPR